MSRTKGGRLYIVAIFIVPILLSRTPAATAWMAEWIKVQATGTSTIKPPRSGHVSFVLNDDIFIFGGYAEEGPAVRYPINDLWKWNDKQEWTCVHPPNLWNPTTDTIDTTSTTSQQQQHYRIPQQRLAAAAASLPGMAFVLGGWDSQQQGTGGVILNDIACIMLQHTQLPKDPSAHAGTSVQWTWDDQINLGLPTSRLVAVPISNSTILIHNHRCIDSVILLTVTTNGDSTTTDKDHTNKDNVISWQVTEQPTTGIAPSPRGLHAATFVPTNRIVIFGGAAQTGEMSNEVFILDTQSWQWSQLSIPINDPHPSPRASPCFCTLDTSTSNSPSTCLLLYGGADRSMADQGIPLHGCDDLWILHLDQPRWEKLVPSTSVIPPGRNAATLTRLPNASSNDGSQAFLLVGGWYPFQTTHAETYMLTVRPTNDELSQ